MTTKKPRKPLAKSKPQTRVLALGTGSPSSEKLLGTGFYRNTPPGQFGREDWLDLLMACQDGRATCMRVLEIIEREMDLQCPSVDHMVNRFLAWLLPESVCPDGCVMDRKYPHRIGTNLLTAVEAQQMFKHVLANAGDVPRAAKKD